MRKFNFAKVTVRDITGESFDLDISKELANQIYRATPDLGELELARDMYKNGEIEIKTPQEAAMIIQYVEKGMVAFVKESVIPSLSNLFSNKVENIPEAQEIKD